ncbi:MAG: hypothetical protein GY941_12580 [Planctomycetes bacterium]|nr:hypothetical protein [Planctomycetota bacterium]
MLKKFIAAIVIACCLLVVPLVIVGTCPGADLDDGISKYTDDGIGKADEVGKLDINISFIIMDALQKQKSKQKKDDDDDGGGQQATSQGGDYYENSIVIGPGATVNGDIINAQ